MVFVFSFTLFGGLDKYCKGMIRNVEEITRRFPTAEIWIYCGNDIPEGILKRLAQSSNVRLFETHQIGLINKIFRYLPIDDPSVDICIVRDSDSRVLDRDQASIEDFIRSEKLVQIVRDHKVHKVPILGGMVGFKKGALSPVQMGSLIHWFLVDDIHYNAIEKNFDFEDDQNFLRRYIYPHVVAKALIQDEYDQPFEPVSMHVKISRPRVFPDFVGQIFEFNEKGEEYTICGGP